MKVMKEFYPPKEMKFTKIATILFVLFFASKVYGQITWQQQGGPYGGSITDIVYHSSGKLYAISSNQLFVSTNLTTPLWQIQPVSSNVDDQINDIEIDGSGNIYVITANNLFISTDNGSTFVKKNTTSQFSAGIRVKKNPSTGTIYVLGYNYSTSKNTIYLSSDGGVTWTTGYAFPNNVFDIAVTAGGYVFSAESSPFTFIEQSTDDGVTFSPVLGTISESSVTSIAVSGSKIICVTTANIYSSADATVSWSSIKGAITGTSISQNGLSPSFITFSPDNSKIYFADNTNHKFYTSAYPTISWTSTGSTNFISSAGVNGINVLSAAAKDAAGNIFYGTDLVGVVKTANSGGVTSEANVGIQGNKMNDFVVASNGNMIVATGTSYGSGSIYTSTDGGQTWTRDNLGNTSYNSYTTLFKVGTSTILAFGSFAAKSTDYGVSWASSSISPAPGGGTYASQDGIKILALSGTNLYYSSNSGQNWGSAFASGLPSNFNTYSFVMDQNLNCGVYGYNPANSNYEFYTLKVTAPSTSVATKVTLTGEPASNCCYSLVARGTKIYVMGRTASSGFILNVTGDGGLTWTPTTLSNGGYRVFVDDQFNYVFVINSQNNSQEMFISRDGGGTFPTTTTLLNTSPEGQLSGMTMDAAGYGYAMEDYNGLYKTTAIIVTPTAPSALTEVGHGTDRIFLRFQDNSTTESYFKVEQFNGSGYDSIGKVSSGFNTSQKMYFERTGLQPNTAYTFRVSAINSAGASPTITSSAITTLAVTTPSIPDNRSWSGSTTNANGLGGPYANYSTTISIKQIGSTGHYSVSDVTGTSISTITGNGSDANLASEFYESSGVTYFEPTAYQLKPQSDGTWTVGTNTITLFWRVDGSTLGGSYPDKYEKINLVLNASDPTPAAPTNVTAYVSGNSSIDVSWSSSAFDKVYTVERSTSAGFGTVTSATVNYPTTVYTDPGPFVAGTTYYYRVKSQNGNTVPGVSGYSTPVASVIFGVPNFVLSNTTVSSTVGSNSGAIWGDFNNDGFDDLIMGQLTIFSGTSSQPLVYQNNGAGNFTLVNNSNLDLASYLVGTAADYDNDGKLDIFFTDLGPKSLLFKGNGDMTFTRVTPSVAEQVDVDSQNSVYLASTWGDYDKDGILDLFVGINSSSYTNILFKGNADGSFTRITTGLEVTDMLQTGTASWVDIDNDGDLDLFLLDGTNGSGVNKLYINSNGTFSASSALSADVGITGFTASWGDYNNDQLLDLFIGTQSTTNYLYKNNGGGSFTKQSSSVIMTDTKVSQDQTFGSVWGDVNNDGFLDLLVSNAMSHQFYLNNGNGTFTKVSSEKISAPLQTFGISMADYDHDGFLDAAMAGLNFQAAKNGGNTAAPSYLFKNNNSTGHWLEVQLKGTSSNRAGIGVRLTLTTASGTQVREIASSSGFAGENSLTAHFGLGSNTTITSLQIKWPSGIVQNMTNITPVNKILVVTEDGTPPIASTLAPSNASTGVSISTTLAITLNKVCTAVAGKNLNLYKSSDLVHPVATVDVTTAVLAGSTFTFTLAQNLLAITNYTVNIDAGAFKDIYGNLSAAITAWTFKTIDNTPPVFKSFVQVPTLTIGGTPSLYPVTVHDTDTVASVTMSHRTISTKGYTDLAGTRNSSTGNWEFAVQSSFFDNQGMEFYFTAKDPSGNAAVLPATGNFSTLIVFPADAMTINLTAGSTTAAGYQIISVPYQLSTFDIASNFEELGSLDKTKYRFLSYHETPTPGWDEYPGTLTTLKRGSGYFINVISATTIKLVSGSAPKENRDTLFVMNLTKGWNEIGNPYIEPIQWDDVMAYNGNPTTVHGLVGFSGGDYHAAGSPGTIDITKGGFVQVDGDISLKIPFKGQTSGGRVIEATFPSDVSQDKWMISLVVKQNGVNDYMTGFGMAPDANLSIDRYDLAPAPRFDDYVEMTVSHPEYFLKRFARDVVPTTPEYHWEFTVDTNGKGQAEMSWDNTTFGEGGKQLYLFDVALQVPIDMRGVNRYTFDPEQSNRFRIYFGDNVEKDIKPDFIMLGDAYPNPASGSTTIPFSLPDQINPYAVKLEVFDIMGKKVATIAEGLYPTGFYAAAWNAAPMNLADGIYIYRLMVGGESKSVVKSSKIILRR
jgi:ASPIC and UnbV/FG-GAP-like repeat/Bacterial Ig-like domain